MALLLFVSFVVIRCHLSAIGTACQYHVRMRLIGNILWLILGWVVARRQLGHYRFGVVHHHCGHSTGYSGVQDGGAHADPVR